MRTCEVVLALGATLLVGPSVGDAATFGVPTNLSRNGNACTGPGSPAADCTAASVDPPGWFVLGAAGSTQTVDPNGVKINQLSLFIEVTGTTLDVLLFDPGTKNKRDLQGDNDLRMDFQLFDPNGTVISQLLSTNDDAGAMENQLARFTPTSDANGNFCNADHTRSCGFFSPEDANNKNTSFSGLNPGVYEFRVTARPKAGETTTNELNFFGVDIRQGPKVGDFDSEAHYNAYVVGTANTSMTVGANDCGKVGNCGTGTPHALVTEPIVFYPYVNRGCTVQTSNFDMDTGAGNQGAGSSGSLVDALAATTALSMSGNDAHSENTVTVENAAAQNLESINYGLYTLSNDTGTQTNDLDWRVSDFQGSTGRAGAPVTPVSPIRTYLPNGYGTVPVEPILAASTRVVSGANPPQAGQVTRFDITATVDNRTASAMTNVQVTIPLVAGATYVAASATGTIDGAAAACTDGSGAAFERCTFASVAAGSAASLSIQVDYAPPASGLRSLTGAPAAGAPPPDTTVWAQYAPAFSSGAFPRTEILGPVCNLVVDVGAAAVVTRATLRGLRVDPAGLVEFATSSQWRTAAFNVYGTDVASGLGPRLRLNRAPVRAPVPDSLTPTLYRVATAPIQTRYLLIEEIDQAGRRRLMGPFLVGDERLRESLSRIEERLNQVGARDHGGALLVMGAQAARLAPHVQSAAAAPLPAKYGMKIEVTAAGRVEVTLADLRSRGLPAGVSPRLLHLTNQGQAVPLEIVKGPTGAPTAIAFRSEALSTAYTGSNVYVLTWSARKPLMAVSLTSWDEPRRPGSERIERNTIYLPGAPRGGDPWLWDLLFGDGSSWPYDVGSQAGSFDLPDLLPGATGDVPVRIRFLGRTDHQHTVDAAINGVAVGSITFEGQVPALLSGQVPADVLRPSGNQLTLRYTAASDPSDVGLIYLNYLDLAAPTSPPSAVVPVDRLAPYDPRLPDFSSADYLIVTHGLFRAEAERIAAFERARRSSHRVVVVDVERAYDAFSSGIAEANAVQALIRRAAGRTRLRYVLLVGGDTFDTHDYLGTGARTFIPSLFAWDGGFGRVPSENRYADLDGDGRPDLAIGRLPVRTLDEAAAMAEKVAREDVVVHAHVRQHIFAVDNQGPEDASFRAEAEEAVGLLRLRARETWADVGQGIEPARDSLLGGMARGAACTHYFGHAGPELWADEGLLTVDDVPGLAGSPETVILSWACEAQWFQSIFGPSLNEDLLLLPQGGAIASFGPAGVTKPELQKILYAQLYRRMLREGSTLGELIRRAKAAALALDPRSQPVVEGWNLLGDPALRVPVR